MEMNMTREIEMNNNQQGKLKSSKGKLIRIIITALIVVVATNIAIKISEYHKENCIDMSTVIDFDVTETGLYLYTDDGNGYYWKALEEIRDINEKE